MRKTAGGLRLRHRRRIFLFAPVFGFDLPHDGEDERRNNLEGFIRGAFLPSPLIDQVFRGVKSPQGLDIYFFRQGAGPNEPPFDVRSSLLRSEPAKARSRAYLEAGLHWTGEVVLADTRWTMVVVPIPGGSPLVNHERSLAVLAMGLLLTMAVMTYVELSRRLDAMRNRFTAATEYRSMLLHTVSIAAKELLTATTVKDAMATVLKDSGEAMRADRVLVFETHLPLGGPLTSELRYRWHSAKPPLIVTNALVAARNS
jgi:hypothetical protein